jgi:RND family efflux transporter MFP subunit
VANATANLTRAQDLFKRGVAARKEVEDAERQIADAQAAVAQAEASRAAAETVATRSIAHATFDGLVAKRYHSQGDVVEPSASDPVLRVIDPQHLEVVASVPLTDVTRIVVGASGRLTGKLAGESEIALKVVSRPSAVDPGTATIPVRLAFARATNLPAGAPVQVAIDAEKHADVIVVPDSAIVREGDETAIFIVNDGKAARHEVKTGLSDGERTEILSGVSASDQVIVEGQATVASDAGSWSWRRTPASARARRSRWTRFVHSRDAARDPRPLRCDHSGTSAAALESLNLALVLLCSTARGKRPEITPATGAWIGFARIETVLTRLELADH